MSINIDDIFHDISPASILRQIMENARRRRKEAKLSQEKLAEKSGVSFGSIKRFERTGEIAFLSLVKIAVTLNSTEQIKELFSKRTYDSIDEILKEKEKEKKGKEKEKGNKRIGKHV